MTKLNDADMTDLVETLRNKTQFSRFTPPESVVVIRAMEECGYTISKTKNEPEPVFGVADLEYEPTPVYKPALNPEPKETPVKESVFSRPEAKSEAKQDEPAPIKPKEPEPHVRKPYTPRTR
jgi:hypothetical protein